MPFVQARNDGSVVITVHVQPRAAKNQVAGLHDGALKLRLTAPPVDGKANKAVIACLASLLGVSKSSLSLVSGHKSRRKQVLVQGVDQDTARRLLA